MSGVRSPLRPPIHDATIHLVPVLLRSGIRLFDRLEPGFGRLERVRFFDGPGATHPKDRLSK
jgi:hypothetical protein